MFALSICLSNNFLLWLLCLLFLVPTVGLYEALTKASMPAFICIKLSLQSTLSLLKKNDKTVTSGLKVCPLSCLFFSYYPKQPVSCYFLQWIEWYSCCTCIRSGNIWLVLLFLDDYRVFSKLVAELSVMAAWDNAWSHSPT